MTLVSSKTVRTLDSMETLSPTLRDRGLVIARSIMARRDNMPIPLSQEESETLALALLQSASPPEDSRALALAFSRGRCAVLHEMDLTDPKDKPCVECSARGYQIYVEGDSLVGATLPTPNDRQVGGSHYGGSAHQHWDIVVEHALDYFQGQVTKYVMRWRKKNGLQDLEKAAHFLEKYITEIKAGRIPEQETPTIPARKLYHDPA